MMRYLTLAEVMDLYRRVMERSGGRVGILNLPALESALAQSRMTFEGKDLYASIVEKASALGFSLINNHPFRDGNKRTGHAAMETFLVLNGHEIDAPVKNRKVSSFHLRPVDRAADSSPEGYVAQAGESRTALFEIQGGAG